MAKLYNRPRLFSYNSSCRVRRLTVLSFSLVDKETLYLAEILICCEFDHPRPAYQLIYFRLLALLGLNDGFGISGGVSCPTVV